MGVNQVKKHKNASLFKFFVQMEEVEVKNLVTFISARGTFIAKIIIDLVLLILFLTVNTNQEMES